MKEVFRTLEVYLGQDKPAPNLVLKIEGEVNEDTMLSLGFEKRDEFFVISRKNAKAIMEKFDFKAWQNSFEDERDELFELFVESVEAMRARSAAK